MVETSLIWDSVSFYQGAVLRKARTALSIYLNSRFKEKKQKSTSDRNTGFQNPVCQTQNRPFSFPKIGADCTITALGFTEGGTNE